MAMELSVQSLSGCEVSGDGETISLRVANAEGEQVRISLSPSQAGSLAMTLPRLLSAALKAKYDDPSVRIVFPVDSCNLEEAPGRSELILSLKSPDGFEVCFCVAPEIIRGLANRASRRVPQHVN